MVKKKRMNKAALAIWIILAILIMPPLLSRFEKPVFTQHSIDNPDFKDKPLDIRPILLQGNSDIGAILVHGLGATAWETKKLAEYLNQKNITTYQVLLAGHGNSIYDLEGSSAEKWYRGLEEDLNTLQEQNKFIIGSSIGSLLALELSQNKELNGIILFSTPITFNDKKIKYTPLIQFFNRYYQRDISEFHQPFYHQNFPVKILAEMVLHIDKIKKTLSEVKSPALIIQSKNDPRLESASAQYVYDNIASEKKEILWLKSNKHVLMIEYTDEDEEFKNERESAFEQVYSFIMDNSE